MIIKEKPSHTTNWLIIGGGIHGVHIAMRLLTSGVKSSALRILDPGTRLLEQWRSCTSATGMKHLRSPSVHHLAVDPWDLQRFENKQKANNRSVVPSYIEPYDRPSLELFNNHSDHLIQKHGLDALHIKARAIRCVVDCDGVDVALSSGGEVRAKHVVLAIGNDGLRWPKWAPKHDPRFTHIFQQGFTLEKSDELSLAGKPKRTIAVVGGGISSCQFALRLAQAGHKVHQICRHTVREHQFDSDPGWLGPLNMDAFRKEPDYDARRAMITEARHSGSVPSDVAQALKTAVAKNQIHWHETDVTHCEFGEHPDSPVEFQLENSERLVVERVFFATGFSTARPGGEMLDELVESAELPCSTCGYPIADSLLRWHPRVHVAGPLAELELGPSSRNIAGARRAAKRIESALHAPRQYTN